MGDPQTARLRPCGAVVHLLGAQRAHTRVLAAPQGRKSVSHPQPTTAVCAAHLGATGRRAPPKICPAAALAHGASGPA